MKPFDLEAAKNGAAVVDSSGPVNIIHFNANSNFPITALVAMVSGKEEPRTYTVNGTRSGCISELEIAETLLKMAPVKKECWINFYGFVYGCSDAYDSEEMAKNSAVHNVISCIHHTWEE